MSRRGVPLLATLLAGVVCGCGRPTPPPVAAASRSGGTVSAAVSREARAKFLAGALSVLDRLDAFDESRAYEQVFDRLNQWSRGAAAAADWRPDPLVATLPDRLQPLARDAALADMTFDATGDVMALRDARWLSDVSQVARGGAVDDLAVAENLFRWTVRSLALVGDPPMVPTDANRGGRWFLPGEILLAGRASGPQRAWVFLELLRQAGLEGVMLATGDAAAGSLRPWVPAVLSGGEAYLFEPTYGMPIPGPDGSGVATVRQAAADPTILAGLSLPDRAYPVQADDLTGLTVLVPASPTELSRRMQLVQQALEGEARMQVAVDASAVGARAVAALPAGDPQKVRLWEFPWETVVRRQTERPALSEAMFKELAVFQVAFTVAASSEGRARGVGVRTVRPLFTARVREFRGDCDGPEGAKASYLSARLGRNALSESLRGVPPEQVDTARRVYEQMKEDAAYWLGVLTLAEGDAATAVDYLERMTIEAAPDSRWTDAARTNLADAFVALGRTADAVRLLREDVSPQRYGSRILADRLERQAATPAATDRP